MSFVFFSHNWEIATREDGFSSKMEPDSAVKVTLRVPLGSGTFLHLPLVA